ncbi:MAG: exodeoxyribonuclease VII small subunit [Oscillospiraceae bacterium]
MSEFLFEDNINNLEKIVQTLEKGEITLEESLELYAKGKKISQDCQSQLKNASLKVEVLQQNKEVINNE